jgi:hypothetical protein
MKSNQITGNTRDFIDSFLNGTEDLCGTKYKRYYKTERKSRKVFCSIMRNKNLNKYETDNLR